MKLLNIFTISSVSAHSWLACTDYAEKNAAEYDHSKCRGWPRNAARFAPIAGVFGGDTGYDTRPQSGTTPCATSRSISDYRDGHHSAVYFKGQQVILAHPMKNHGASTQCLNKYIPDNGNWIYQADQTKPGEADPVLSVFKEKKVVDLGISPFGHSTSDSVANSYPKPGYQNAPKLCDDTDKALATYSFNVPENLEVGEYTFVWLWAFNSPTDYYSTCFEVEIVETPEERENIFKSRGQFDFSLPCDSSITSTGDAGSMVGCGGDNGSTGGDTGKPTPKPTPKPGTTQATTLKTTSVRTTTEKIIDTQHSKINFKQMTGSIQLPDPAGKLSRRQVFVTFYDECARMSNPNFWYASKIGTTDANNKITFELEQKSRDDINRKEIGFHWAFSGNGCDYENAVDVRTVDTF